MASLCVHVLPSIHRTATHPRSARPTDSTPTGLPWAGSRCWRHADLWEVAYPNGAEPTEALRFFADDLRYEDFNYEDVRMRWLTYTRPAQHATPRLSLHPLGLLGLHSMLRLASACTHPP